MMPSREFPAPPDLSELLKFFESAEGKARVKRQNGPKGTPRAATQRSRAQSAEPAIFKPLSGGIRARNVSSPPKLVATGGRRLSQPTPAPNSEHRAVREDKTSVSSQGWNASTLLPTAPDNTLRHQLLSRTYQPPPPVYALPSEASELLGRLAKGTISSRSKVKSQGDAARSGQNGGLEDESASNGVRPTFQADTRARDAIQTLLFYRKEVDKRRRLDSSNSRADE